MSFSRKTQFCLFQEKILLDVLEDAYLLFGMKILRRCKQDLESDILAKKKIGTW